MTKLLTIAAAIVATLTACASDPKPPDYGWLYKAPAPELVAEAPVVVKIAEGLDDHSYYDVMRGLMKADRKRPLHLVLSSPGGPVYWAARILDEVDLHQRRGGIVATEIPDGSICGSACALIWLQGRPRTAGPASIVAVHAARRAGGGILRDPRAQGILARHATEQLKAASPLAPPLSTWTDYPYIKGQRFAAVDFQIPQLATPIPPRVPRYYDDDYHESTSNDDHAVTMTVKHNGDLVFTVVK